MTRPIASGQTGDTRAFSLAEVVIALGVITVGVIAVLGVFPIALQTGHSAQDETRAGHIAQSVFGSLVPVARAECSPIPACCLGIDCSRFHNVQIRLSNGVSPSIDLTTSSSYTLYAGNDGQLTNSATDATYAITIYTNNSVPGFTDPASANAVTVRVAWPANALAANQTFRDYVRIISKY